MQIADPHFRRALELLDAGDRSGLEKHLREHPSLVHERVMFEGEGYGATVDIAVAVGLGRMAEVRQALAPADAQSRHRALALAAQHGHAGIVVLLLDAGEDPDRYNPAGFHAHSTPLHQAALAGHLEVVRTLIEHGARTDLRDTLFDGTPLGWAEHGKQAEVAAYLRAVSLHS